MIIEETLLFVVLDLRQSLESGQLAPASFAGGEGPGNEVERRPLVIESILF